MYQWLDRAPKGRNETGVWWQIKLRRIDGWRKIAAVLSQPTAVTA